ncbi:MAG: DUF1616 domain-containing protein [Candidatus Bathyarchaeia archaeon]|jgi:uncharacterized membrane protein
MSVFQKYRALFFVVAAVLVLAVASPLIEQYASAPKTEPLTELSVLGPYHNATYPYNLTSGDIYPLYFTVSNQLGVPAQYKLEIKFRTQEQSGPDSFNHTQSSLPPLTDFTFKVENGKSVELQVNLAFDYRVGSREANLNSIDVNETSIDMDNLPVPWDYEADAYLGNVFFELYLYNDSTGNYQYHQRYVSLWVNLR